VVADFTGRAAERGRLNGMLAQSVEAGVMPVAVVSGPPGMGKTTLALRVAHSLRASFPDGQLYLQLAGASGRPRDPGEVLGDVLRALGTAPAVIPDGTEQRAALYRSRLADRRVLVVADDAESARQVRPLLPGTAGCAVLVTSRSRLADLGGARLLPLEPLTGGEAVELLGRIVGAGRVAAEPKAADRLVHGCGLLPLAVRIAGAKLAARPRWPLEAVVGMVADERRRLDELALGDLAVRASVAPSYVALDERDRRAFRLLSSLGPVDVAEWVLAALLGEPAAADVANTLADRSLLAPAGVDATGEPRYRLHDLLRDYAAERLAEDPGPARDAAVDRVTAGYLQLATLAHGNLPRLDFFPPVDQPADAPVLPAGLAARLTADPVAWFNGERLNLLALIGWACAQGRPRAAARLAATQASYQFLQHRVDDAEQMWTVVRDAAAAAGDTAVASDARFHLAWATAERGHFAGAHAALQECVPVLEAREAGGTLAPALYWRAFCAQHLGLHQTQREDAGRCVGLARRLGEPGTEAMGLRILGLALVETGQHDRGLAVCEQAVAIAGDLAEPALEYHALTTLAYAMLVAGKHQLAESCCRRGIEVCGRFDPYVTGEAFLLGMLGDAYIGQGRHRDGIDVLGTAMAMFEERGDRWGVALCLLKQGRAYLALGHPDEAGGLLRRCLTIFRELGLPAYEEAAAEALRACPPAPGRPGSKRPTAGRPAAGSRNDRNGIAQRVS
jgi:tetratricopeptide (TPR) repeat protein